MRREKGRENRQAKPFSNDVIVTELQMDVIGLSPLHE
jgi:hypothetical protein